MPKKQFWPSLLLTNAVAACLFAQSTAGQDTPLEARLRSLATVHRGKVALYAEDLTTGKTVSLDADTPVQTASVIKLTVLYEALQQIRDGRAHFDDKITFTHEDQVSGSGILPLFDTPQKLTFKDALTLMIVLSDNTATNLSIDHLGLKISTIASSRLASATPGSTRRSISPPRDPCLPTRKFLVWARQQRVKWPV